MPTQAEAAAHRAAVADIATLALAELVTEWDGLPLDDPARLAGALSGLLEELIHDFGPMVGAIAADWYEELRTIEAELNATYLAILADLPELAQIQDTAAWASSAAYVDTEKALHDSGAALDRLLVNVDRDTIAVNVERDPARPRYARYASANACAFCAMNALRGPVYRSEEAAAGKYHRDCRCVAVPVWTPDGYQEAPYVADWREAYHAATSELGGARDMKAILAHMRQGAGLR